MYIWLFATVLSFLAQQPDLFRCIRSSRDRLDFYEEIPIQGC